MAWTMPLRSPMASGRYSDRGVEPTETSPAGMGGCCQHHGREYGFPGLHNELSGETSHENPIATPQRNLEPQSAERAAVGVAEEPAHQSKAFSGLRQRWASQLDPARAGTAERDRVDQQDGSGPRTAHGATVPAHMSITGVRPRVGSAIPRANTVLVCCRPRLF